MAYGGDERDDDWEAGLAEGDQPWNDEDPDDADEEDDEDERSWHDDLDVDPDGYGEGGTVIVDEGPEDDGRR